MSTRIKSRSAAAAATEPAVANMSADAASLEHAVSEVRPPVSLG